MVDDTNYTLDCILGLPWLSLYQATKDCRLFRSIKRRSGYYMSEVFTHQFFAPTDWPHVRVLNDLTSTNSQQRESDVPLCSVC